MKILKKLSWFFVILSAFALGIKQIHEPDLWWMFRTGEWMVQNGKIPTTDVFSFTLTGTDWISVKWLFELIAYGFAFLMGPESIGILQGMVNVTMVYFFTKTIQNLVLIIYGIELKKTHSLLILGSLLLLFVSDYRLVGRPEMFSHLFTVIYLSIFIQYKLKPGRFIFWLIPLQIIWVNIHEGFAVGIVMLLCFGIGYAADYFLSKQKDKKVLHQILLASGIAVLSVAINPRGFYMFYHPYFLFSVVGSNHYTNELNSVFYQPAFYFSFKEPFFAFGSFVLALIGIFGLYFRQRGQMFSKISSAYIVLMFAFIYLGMTGYRNVIFPILLIYPLVFALVIGNTNKWESSKYFKYWSISIWLLPFLFYFSVVGNQYYEAFQNKDRFGLATYANSNPAGAAKFSKDHGLTNQRCFSDYLTSSYFLWKLSPGFESYIDLRDLDIFPKSFFEEFIRITHFTNFFEESDLRYNYEYAMLYTWQYPNLHRYLYHSPNWQQVYADKIATVYVKNNLQNQKLIQEFSFDSTNLYGNFNTPFQPQPSLISKGVSYALWPLFDLYPTQPDSSITASKYFRIVADFDRAEFHAQNAINNNTSPYEGWSELGNIYLEIVPYKKTQEGKLKYINMANVAFSNGVKLDKGRWDCAFGMATCASLIGDYAYALKLFKKAQKLDPENAANCIKIADCYANLYKANQNPNNLKYWFENMNLAQKLQPNNMNILTQLAIAYCQRNECEKAEKLLLQYERTTDISEKDHLEIQKCKKRCSVK